MVIDVHLHYFGPEHPAYEEKGLEILQEECSKAGVDRDNDGYEFEPVLRMVKRITAALKAETCEQRSARHYPEPPACWAMVGDPPKSTEMVTEDG